MPDPIQSIRNVINTLLDTISAWQDIVSGKLDDILTALGAITPGGDGANVVDAVEALGTSLGADNVIISGQVQQIIDLLGNYVVPYLENIFYNGLAAGNPLVPPVLTTTDYPSDSEQELCQRAQWMVDYFFDTWMHSLADSVNNVSDAAVAIGVAALIAGTEGLGAAPLSLMTAGIAGARLARAEGLAGLYDEATSPRRVALYLALYQSANASSAQDAWYSTIDGFSDVNAAYRTCWKAFIWSDWFNHLFDPATHNHDTEAPKWDLDVYDGLACVIAGGPSGTWHTVSTTFTAGSYRAVFTAPPFDSVGNTGTGPFDPSPYAANVFLYDSTYGMYWRVSSNSNPVYLAYAPIGGGGPASQTDTGSTPELMPLTTCTTIYSGADFVLEVNIPA